MKYRIITSLIAVFALLCPSCSCHKETPIDSPYLDEAEINIRVKGRYVFKYDPLTCQYSYNPDYRTFRCFTDNASDYFNVMMKSTPKKEGEYINADLVYTKGTGVSSNKSLKFKVVKKDDSGKVWLWCSKSEIALCIQLID